MVWNITVSGNRAKDMVAVYVRLQVSDMMVRQAADPKQLQIELLTQVKNTLMRYAQCSCRPWYDIKNGHKRYFLPCEEHMSDDHAEM